MANKNFENVIEIKVNGQVRENLNKRIKSINYGTCGEYRLGNGFYIAIIKYYNGDVVIDLYNKKLKVLMEIIYNAERNTIQRAYYQYGVSRVKEQEKEKILSEKIEIKINDFVVNWGD